MVVIGSFLDHGNLVHDGGLIFFGKLGIHLDLVGPVGNLFEEFVQGGVKVLCTGHWHLILLDESVEGQFNELELILSHFTKCVFLVNTITWSIKGC